jgi:hypothetical protein
MVGGAGNAPVVTSDVYFSTPVLQTGSRNASRKGVDGFTLIVDRKNKSGRVFAGVAINHQPSTFDYQPNWLREWESHPPE